MKTGMQKPLFIGIALILLVAGCAYTTLNLMFLSIPIPKTPLLLLSPSDREKVCNIEDIFGDLYTTERVITPQAILTLQQSMDEQGNPDGYVAHRALNEPRCFFWRFFWFEKGISITTVYLPTTDKISLNTPIRTVEEFDPVDSNIAYAQQQGIDVASFTDLYHKWVGIDAIVYP